MNYVQNGQVVKEIDLFIIYVLGKRYSLKKRYDIKVSNNVILKGGIKI